MEEYRRSRLNLSEGRHPNIPITPCIHAPMNTYTHTSIQLPMTNDKWLMTTVSAANPGSLHIHVNIGF
jgi:hypothetical protein